MVWKLQQTFVTGAENNIETNRLYRYNPTTLITTSTITIATFPF